MKKRIVLLTMIMLMLFSSFASAAEVSVDNSRASEYILSYSAEVSSTSDSTVTVRFSILGNSYMDMIGVKTIVLQERASSLDSWDTYGTYGYEDYANMMKSNAQSYTNGLTFDVTSGMQYRAKVYFYAEDGGYDTRTYTTNWVQAQ